MSHKNLVLGIGAGVGVLVVAALAFPLSNMGEREVDAEVLAKVSDPVLTDALPLYKNKCMDCHSAEGDLPFYAGLPVASGLIEGHRTEGLAHWNMDAEWLEVEAPTEASLARVQQVFDEGSMPPSQYTMLHWSAAVSPEDAAANLEWVRHARAAASGYDPADPLLDRAVLPIVPIEGLNPAEVALGDKLYHDVRLSGDDTLSCASCHGLDMGGSDEARTSTGINGQLGPINSPTVYNAVYMLAQFWDGRAADLEEQAGGPVENPIEMGATFEQVLAKLDQDPELVAEFVAVYGQPAVEGEEEPAGDDEYVRPAELSQANIQKAIAAFEMTLTTPDSAFDKYLKGDAAAMSAEAVAGWELFDSMGCDTCHAGQAMGGTSFEKMGTHHDYFAMRGGELTEVDAGRANFTKDEADKHKFKVPTLRNLEKTFPYFHDGSVTDMGEAVKIMAEVQRGRSLTDAETANMVAFMGALTGEYNGQPLP